MKIVLAIYIIGLIIFLIKGSSGKGITLNLIINSLVWPIWIIFTGIIAVTAFKEASKDNVKEDMK